jgi:hypothetical protein
MVTDRQDPACRSPKNVETPRHLATIREYSRDQVQGYQVGRPMRMVAPGELTAARAPQRRREYRRSRWNARTWPP